MAVLRVLFRDGDEVEWPLHERMAAKELVKMLTQGMDKHSVVSFGTDTDNEDVTQADYGFVGFRMDDVLWWRLDGLVDESALLGPWAEADHEAGQDDDPGAGEQ